MPNCLQRCASRGIMVKSVIDVGAAEGRWSMMASKYFPDAQYFMIEAQKPHAIALTKLSEQYDNFDFVIAAASDICGTVYFNNSDLLGGEASKTKFENNCIEVRAISIDQEVKERNLQPPYILKLDTHGYELPILKGASDTIAQCSLVIIEAYNYHITSESIIFYDLCRHMDDLGFRPIEMADQMLREYDSSFWQADIFFVPKENAAFMYNAYR